MLVTDCNASERVRGTSEELSSADNSACCRLGLGGAAISFTSATS